MPIYLSASSIADFIRCPQKVMYRIKKTVKAVQSKDMIMGEVIHYVLEKGWKSREAAYSIAKHEVETRDLRKDDLTNLQFMIDMFFLNFAGLLGDSDLIEYNFKLPLYDDIFIVGKIDRISKGNVFDWKSGKLPTRLGNDVQCIIYDWAFRKLFDKEPASLCQGGLSEGKLLPYVKDEVYTKELFNNIIPRMIRTIRHDEYERLGMFNHSCFRCPWKIGCLGKPEEYVLDNPIFTE